MTFTQEELNEILKKHKKWLNNEEEGEKANLIGVDLRYADLEGTDLRLANLTEANLKGANLKGANLECANLKGANLICANLEGVNLGGANLEESNLKVADLRKANLEGANLICTNLEGADLREANLEGSDIDKSNLLSSFLDENEKYRLGVILKEPLTGYKKCRNEKIVTLEIPKGAIVYCINGGKCRTNKVKVISISEGTEAVSIHNKDFVYKIGEEIDLSDTFDMAYNNECGSGIHFFKILKEAIDY